ncbi:MAG: Ca2+:H+ antiporter, partial [Solirubrobacteraceae bacterium]|nr:Ca2+:H+ antiporter [Solirubrobacteraceae bacterium]
MAERAGTPAAAKREGTDPAPPDPDPPKGGAVGAVRRFLLSGSGWPYLLVPFIPIAIALKLGHAEATLIFGAAAAGVIPTAALMGRATEELAHRAGPGI